MENIVKAFGRAWSKLRDWVRTGLSGMRKIFQSVNPGRVGYYAALALLLALLGGASWAYRNRAHSQADVVAAAPRPALSVHAPEGTPEPVATPEPILWQLPLEGDVVGAYSPDAPVWSKSLQQWQTHPALDFAGAPGEAVYACREGIVADAWSDRVWGNVIVIDHGDGYVSKYASLNTLNMAAVGDAIEAGQVIGSVGQSSACEADLGWHLHFELTKDGKPVDLTALVNGNR